MHSVQWTVWKFLPILCALAVMVMPQVLPQQAHAAEAEVSLFDLAPTPPQTRIWYGKDVLQFGDLRLPEGKGPFPLVVVIHGGYWRSKYNLDHISLLCDAFTAAGAATWSLEYRRVGDAGGAYPGTFQDIGAGIDYVRELNKHCMVAGSIDLDNVVVVGHSAGGHLGAWAASRSHIPAGHVLHAESPLPLKGVVALAGLMDLEFAAEKKLSNSAVEGLLEGAPADRYRYTSPIKMLPPGAPIVMLHGTKDEDVPIEVSELYMKAATDAGVKNVQYKVIEGSDHYHLIDPRSMAWDVVRQSTFDLFGK